MPGSGTYCTSIDHGAKRKPHSRNVSELSKSMNAVGSILPGLTGGSVLSTSRNVPAASFSKSIRPELVNRDARNNPSPNSYKCNFESVE